LQITKRSIGTRPFRIDLDSTKGLVLYLARHRFGAEALRAGVPLKDIADLMGHASVTTTEIYLHRDVTELAGSQDRLPQFAFEPA
jgi:site-specific recombinase XerD